MKVGIFAPSSKVPASEFDMGLARIRSAGFEPVVHPHTLAGHHFFAGTDEQRAQAVWEFAQDPSLPVLWTARGGYGSARILPLLDALAKKRRKPLPQKLMLGYSDSTALLDYVRTRWGWQTLHAPMPGLRQFCLLPEAEWAPLVALLRGQKAVFPWSERKLEWIGPRPKAAITAPLVGGNLSVWTSLIGTPHAISAKGKLVFLEDVDENLYRVDRMVQQLIHSGALKGAKAVVLGNYLNCRDVVPKVLTRTPDDPSTYAQVAREPDPAQLVPLRATMEPGEALRAIFEEIPRRLKIPVAGYLPVGHGPEKAPLPLGGKYELSPAGRLQLLTWGRARG